MENVTKKNFQVTAIEDGKKYWISPSVAVCCIVYTESGVVAHKRGSGCPDEQHKWSVNCGYIDWFEKLEDAVAREVYEEIGLRIDKKKITFLSYNNPSATDANLTLRFKVKVSDYDIVSGMNNGTINTDTVMRGGEKNEVDEITVIPFDKIDMYDWAFNHGKLINTYMGVLG